MSNTLDEQPTKRPRSRWDRTLAAPTEQTEPLISGDIPTDDSTIPKSESQPSARPARRSRWNTATIEQPADQPLTEPHQPTPSQAVTVSLSTAQHQTMALARYSQHVLPLTDKYLDHILPPGFRIVPTPVDYVPPSKMERKMAMADQQQLHGLDNPALAAMADADDTAASFIGALATSNVHDILDLAANELDIISNLPEELQDMNFPQHDVALFAPLFHPDTPQTEKDIYTHLFKVKNGHAQLRKQSTRRLLRNPKIYTFDTVIKPILIILSSDEINAFHRHAMFSLLMKLITIHGRAVRPYTKNILKVTQTLLVDSDHFVREEGGQLIRILTKAAGLGIAVSAVRDDVNSSDEYTRNVTARTLAYVCSVVGVEAMFPFIEALVNSQQLFAIESALRLIQHISVVMKASLVPFMDVLLTLVNSCLNHSSLKIVTAALLAAAKICEYCAPYRCPAVESTALAITSLFGRLKSRPLIACTQCLTMVIPLLSEDITGEYWSSIEEFVKQCLLIGTSESIVTTIKAYTAAIRAKSFDYEQLRTNVLTMLTDMYLNVRTCSDKAASQSLKEFCVHLAQLIGTAPLIASITDRLGHDNINMVTCVANIIAHVIITCGVNDLPPEQEKVMINGFLKAIESFPTDEPELSKLEMSPWVFTSIASTGSFTTDRLIIAFSVVLEALGPTRSLRYLQEIVGRCRWKLRNAHAHIRYQGTVLLSRAVACLRVPDEPLFQSIWEVVIESLGEELPAVISGLLCALTSTIVSMKFNNVFIDADTLNPSPNDVLVKLVAMLHNRNPCVSFCACRALTVLGERWGPSTDPREWIRIVSNHATELLRHGHRASRNTVVALVAISAQIAGSADVVLKLLPLLQHSIRSVRVGATSCFGAIAQSCGVSTVLPLLFHQYQISTLQSATAVVKACVVCVQHCRSESVMLANACYPLLIHTLTNKHPDIVRSGFQLATALVSSTAQANADISKQLAGAVGSFIAPFRAINHNIDNWWWEWRRLSSATSSAIGGSIARALWAGLFHCASRVRETHWNWYNNLLAHKQHAMPMHHIKITRNNQLAAEDEHLDPYVCHSLMLPL